MPVVRFFFSETKRYVAFIFTQGKRALAEQFARSAPFGVLIRLNHARQVTIIISNNLRENVRRVKTHFSHWPPHWSLALFNRFSFLLPQSQISHIIII